MNAPITTLLETHNAKDLLRFITCGNVDDGKSTLIGRLLLECGAIYDDQIEALRDESAKHGTLGQQLDPALLLDGLEDERQQGITIDVAYRYFTTDKRKFIIADCPGHEQFTRNMVTAASTAGAAIILVDASKGITSQTRRHAYLVALLGIRHLLLVVNKMDLVDFRQARFDEIATEFRGITETLPPLSVHAVPVSARDGDNVLQPSPRTAWFTGLPVLRRLEQIPCGDEIERGTLRFPVQWVNRPHADFRGFCGTVASGSLRVGDPVMVLPSRRTTHVTSLITMDGPLRQADAGNAVTVTLAQEIDVTRGDVLVTPDASPRVTQQVTAATVWMSTQPLICGKRYWAKLASRRTSCEVQSVQFRTDISTLRPVEAATLGFNEIGVCHLRFHDPMVVDDYSENRHTGALILVDRVTHETVAACMVVDHAATLATGGHWDETSKLVRPQLAMSRIAADARSARYGLPPLTILITGLSGSGKTTVAVELERLLFEAGHPSILLDGQNLRAGLNRDLGFSAEERSENLRRAAEIAKLINEAGQVCIAAFVAPNAWVRGKVRQRIGEERLVHVHLTTPLEVCRQRDQTGQYRAAERGDLPNFPGATTAYEPVHDAQLTFDTSQTSPERIALDIFLYLKWTFGDAQPA